MHLLQANFANDLAEESGIRTVLWLSNWRTAVLVTRADLMRPSLGQVLSVPNFLERMLLRATARSTVREADAVPRSHRHTEGYVANGPSEFKACRRARVASSSPQPQCNLKKL